MILAFTDDLIVKAHAAEADDETSDPRASAVRRSTITELEIRSTAGAFDDDIYTGATWPGNLFVTARFSPWTAPIGLPLEETGQSVHKEWLIDTLASLRADLLA
jgi:hypothetical protein